MPAIEVTSGPARVVASGSATCFMGHELTLTIEEPVAIVVDLAFESDPSVEDVAVDVATFANRMRLVCKNFDRADGRGSAQPVLLGEAGDLLVFLHFRVFLYGRTADRTVHYTLYAVRKDDVGWEPE
ncbi:MAG: hypothetical protein H6736_03410 [Alphaproteobacteria bacterium]|nr:hypothetical protein [Alphaproteobacteria bacterium]MCB9690843.1 hypothetical protein [Alphaproteobacteria bacterium]